MPDGALLATCGSDRLIKFSSPRTGALLGTLAGHRGAVNSLCFSPDGRTLITAGADGALKAWSVAASEELFDLYQHDNHGLEELSISPDGRHLAVTTSFYRRVLLFDLGEAPAEPLPR